MFELDFVPESTKNSHINSEIFLPLPGCHLDFRLDMTWWKRPFRFECQLEMADDPVDGFRFFDKRNDPHPAARGSISGLETQSDLKS
ncbi:MAG: hypothetical protein JXK07_10255, partial [Spirochaetes bacterium]|nr:hypothetical protein [Spirochaetota bacterium]